MSEKLDLNAGPTTSDVLKSSQLTMGLSQYTTYLAHQLCGGSSRKLIAGWWYSILGLTFVLMGMSLVIMSTRERAESFAAIWSGLMLFCLAVGGTMIMRKFHNSMAVGFFMGSVVVISQMFFLLFLVYMGYAKDQQFSNMPAKEESVMAFLALCQSLLLGSFAAILAAHRSEILDKPGNAIMDMMDEAHGLPSSSYDAPNPAASASP